MGQGLGWHLWVRAGPGPVLLLGPETDDAILPAVRVAWDAAQRDWVWSGPPDARRLAPGEVPTPPAPPAEPLSRPPSLEDRVLTALARPEAAAALAGLAADRRAALLGPDRLAALRRESLAEPRFPESAWTLPPDEAALVFARANSKRFRQQ
jgi:hypothetical protein